MTESIKTATKRKTKVVSEPAVTESATMVVKLVDKAKARGTHIVYMPKYSIVFTGGEATVTAEQKESLEKMGLI